MNSHCHYQGCHYVWIDITVSWFELDPEVLLTNIWNIWYLLLFFLKYNNKRGIHHCSLLYAFLHWIWKSALLLSWDYKPKKYLPNSILLRSFSNRLSRCNVFNPCFGFSCDCILDQSWSISRRSKYSHFYPHNHMVFFLFLPVMPTKSTFLYTFPLWEHVVFISRVTGYTYLDSRTPWIFTNWEKQ